MSIKVLRRLALRLCMLAALTGVLVFLAAPIAVKADADEDCFACDSEYSGALYTCGTNFNSCVASIPSNFDPDQYALAVASCAVGQSVCTTSAQNTYAPCLDACVTGTYQYTAITYQCRQRTACDNACIDDKISCLANGGDTCGADFYDCELYCCS